MRSWKRQTQAVLTLCTESHLGFAIAPLSELCFHVFSDCLHEVNSGCLFLISEKVFSLALQNCAHSRESPGTHCVDGESAYCWKTMENLAWKMVEVNSSESSTCHS